MSHKGHKGKGKKDKKEEDALAEGVSAVSLDDATKAENKEAMEKIAETDELLRAIKQPSLAEAVAEAAVMSGAAAKAAKPDLAALLGLASAAVAGSGAEAKNFKAHRFWDTQPVPKLGAEVTEHGPIDPPKTIEEVKQEPYALPAGYKWVTMDVTDDAQLQEVYELLKDHYVEDDENMFRFCYPAKFLRWALTPPHYFPDWHIGVRDKDGILIGCITGVPATMKIYNATMLLCEINYLCVHKTRRSMRIAPVLIKEVTRRVNLKGIFQATYTAGVVLPKPVASCQYWHRSINPKKLIDVGFSRLAPRMTMARTIRFYNLPDAPKTPGIRPLETRDIPAACKLVNHFLNKFQLHPVFTEEDFAHWLIPIPGIIDTYVVEDPSDHELTDFISFYHVPSTVIGHERHKDLHGAYAYYVVPGKHTLHEIMEDTLILAKVKGVDVFNALDLLENATVVKDLKFGPGDGHLQYYLYNWKCPEMKPEDVGLVLM